MKSIGVFEWFIDWLLLNEFVLGWFCNQFLLNQLVLRWFGMGKIFFISQSFRSYSLDRIHRTKQVGAASLLDSGEEKNFLHVSFKAKVVCVQV